jgi:hypothetical protein
MRIILFLLLSVLCLYTAAGQSCTIEGQIKNLGNDTVFVELNALSKTPDIDTVLASNGRFTYTRKIDKATIAIIDFKKTAVWNTPANRSYFPSSKQIRIILLPNDHSYLQGQLSSQGIHYTIKGNALNEELASFEQKNLDERIAQEKAFRKIDSLVRIGKPGEAGPFANQMGEQQQRIQESRQEYIDNHPDKELSAYLVACSGNPETFGNAYAKLDDKVRNGLLKNILDEKNALYRAYINAKEITPGAHAENFTLTDIDGKTFTLADRKGKYILLDFWGSWCGPCIRGIPALKEYQENIKTRSSSSASPVLTIPGNGRPP